MLTPCSFSVIISIYIYIPKNYIAHLWVWQPRRTHLCEKACTCHVLNHWPAIFYLFVLHYFTLVQPSRWCADSLPNPLHYDAKAAAKDCKAARIWIQHGAPLGFLSRNLPAWMEHVDSHRIEAFNLLLGLGSLNLPGQVVSIANENSEKYKVEAPAGKQAFGVLSMLQWLRKDVLKWKRLGPKQAGKSLYIFGSLASFGSSSDMWSNGLKFECVGEIRRKWWWIWTRRGWTAYLKMRCSPHIELAFWQVHS